ncbi:hypothetical protein NDU88_002474 [Pleurodeles waltl]|uniref:Uncharacterized protein n=1 Tax=Pleurodeles waltl TaxID=8319 RepID=A0AAV7TKR0_PLEWA|nr:hypothetical protein NDU88_002474 [Pleurodeles waltl]
MGAGHARRRPRSAPDRGCGDPGRHRSHVVVLPFRIGSAEGLAMDVGPKGELSQLEQEHSDTADTCTLGHIRVKVQEYQETALSEIRHMGKYAVARTYGEGDRPGKVLPNLIRPSRSANRMNKSTATDGSILTDPEDIAARFREYYQTLYTTKANSEPNVIKEYLTHIVLPKLSESDTEALVAPFTLIEIAKALGSMAEGKARVLMA